MEQAHSLIQQGVITKENYFDNEITNLVLKKISWPIPERNCRERERRIEFGYILVHDLMVSIFYDNPLKRWYELPDDDSKPISELTDDEIDQKLKQQIERRKKIYIRIQNYEAWDTTFENSLAAELQLRDSFQYSLDLITHSHRFSDLDELNKELRTSGERYLCDITDLSNQIYDQKIKKCYT